MEVVDEDKVQSFDADIGPAQPVSDSLVEIVQENESNTPQKSSISKRPLESRVSLPSLETFKFTEHKVHALQSHHRKPRVKLKPKFATGRPSPSKTNIFTRVSIPGKHMLFNISHSWSKLLKLLSSRKFSPLRTRYAYGGSALQLSDNVNAKHEGKKRNNQMERNQASSRDVLDAFVSRMGLNGNGSYKGDAGLSPRKDSLQRIATNRTNSITGKPTRVSDSSGEPTVRKGVPLEKKEKTIQVEPEVFNSLSDKKALNGKKHLKLKGRQENGQTSNKTKSLSDSFVSNNVGSSSDVIGSGRVESGSGKKIDKTQSQISQQSLPQTNKVTQPNTTGTPSLDKGGTSPVSSQSRTRANDTNLLSHRKNESHNLTVVNNTKLSIQTKSAFALPLNPNASKHFSELINFFNSFESSSSKKLPTIKGNSTSQKLLRFLDLIHIRKSNATYTRKRLGMTEAQNHSNQGSTAEQNRKRLQMSIYRGWNAVGKVNRPGTNKSLALANSPVKNRHADPNHAMGFETNHSLKKSKGNTFELDVLQMMKNVSEKELLELEGEIKDMLSSARLLNLSRKNGRQSIGLQQRISLKKLEEKHQQALNRQHGKQDHLSGERLNFKKQQTQQLLKQTQKPDMFQHRNLKVGRQQNQTQIQKTKNKKDKEQIQDNDIGTAFGHHQLEQESEQSYLQETNQSRHFLKKMNLSLSTNSTTVQNCTSRLPVTNKRIGYGCYQTNGSTVFLLNSSSTLEADTDTLNKTGFHKNSSHNLTFITSPLVYHTSTRKTTKLKTISPARNVSSGTVKSTSFNASEEMYDIRNISIHLDRDTYQKMDDESIYEGKLDSGVEEITELVDQGKLVG